ncbi:MAG TPA: alpha/beta hydrolase [Actinocrinis sp.]|nr:alpha/beta hydrolase [Actinocrinis sp.]
MNVPRIRLKRALALAMATGLGLSLIFAQGAYADSRHTGGTGHCGCRVQPTIVLVHGAWADGTGWADVVRRLQAEGYKNVVAPANPLRSLPGDSTYIASFLASIKGPIVLVGHSYGGAVITNAATGNPNVKALVYIAAFAPTAGETLNSIIGAFPGSQIGPALTPVPYTDGTTSGTDLYIQQNQYRNVFLSDFLPQKQALVMAASQRPLAAVTFDQPSGTPAWQTIPSWYMVAQQDHTIPPDAERFMAARAHAHTVEVNAPHVAYVTDPGAVTRLIDSAVDSVIH